jgi:hypothetical protein
MSAFAGMLRPLRLFTAPVDNPVDETPEIRLQPYGYRKSAKLSEK